MNFQEYVNQKNYNIPPLELGQVFVTAKIEIDSVFVEKDVKVPRLVLIGPDSERAGVLGTVIAKQAQTLKNYFEHTPNAEPVKVEKQVDNTGKRPFFYLTADGIKIPQGE